MSRIYVVVMLIAAGCGGKQRTDIGACEPFMRDGKEYLLCEKKGGAALAKSANTVPEPGQDNAATETEAESARRAAEHAIKDAREAAERVEALMKELDELDVKVSAAVSSIESAQSDADRVAATAKLKALQRENEEMKKRAAEAKAGAKKAEKRTGIKSPNPECMDNPLAKGCL